MNTVLESLQLCSIHLHNVCDQASGVLAWRSNTMIKETFDVHQRLPRLWETLIQG